MKRPPIEETPDLAVALEYDGESAPRVTAKGRGPIAERILALARDHDIPIQERPELVQLLSRINLGDEIPQALYIAVAEIIAFAYILKGRTGPKTGAEKDASRMRE